MRLTWTSLTGVSERLATTACQLPACNCRQKLSQLTWYEFIIKWNGVSNQHCQLFCCMYPSVQSNLLYQLLEIVINTYNRVLVWLSIERQA